MLSEVGTFIHPALQFTEITEDYHSHRIFAATNNGWANTLGMNTVAEKLQSYWGMQGFNPDQDICFITNRAAKFDEVKTLLEGLSIKQAPIKLTTLDQEDNLINIAVYRVFQGFKQLQMPCFIEEAALNVDVPGYEKPFPGNQYRQVVERMMGKKTFAKQYDGLNATTLSVFAYTKDGKTAHVFTGDCKGKIVNPGDNFEDVDGWDPFFHPNGYGKSLAELKKFKHIVNMRYLPCAEMRTQITGKEYCGMYELHVTVYNCSMEILNGNNPLNPLIPEPEYLQKFDQACGEIGVKALHIKMNKKTKPMQLQTAAYHRFENYAKALEGANKTAQLLQLRGLPILRIRLEAMLFNEESPKTDLEAIKATNGNYFEFHARLEGINDDNFEIFEEIVKKHRTHVAGTHNLGHIKVNFSSVGQGHRYFGNMRCYKIGSETAMIAWKSLLREFVDNKFIIAKEVKPEYCVYDQRPDLDSIKYKV